MEAVRRILNTSDCLPQSEKVSHLNNFSNCMRWSGYSKEDRFHTISGAIKQVRDMTSEVERSERDSLSRGKKHIVMAQERKIDWSSTWYLKGPITPGSDLKKELNKVINESRPVNDKVLVIEDGGMPIMTGLKVKDLMRSMGCIFRIP